jgi:hypothetical protein
MTREEFYNYMSEFSKEPEIANTCLVDGVSFPFVTGLRLMRDRADKSVGEHSKEQFGICMWQFDFVYEKEFAPYVHYLDNFTVKEALALENSEQIRVAMEMFTPEEVVSEGGLELVATETVFKKQKGWTISKEHGLEEKTLEYEDTYTLYKGEVNTPIGKNIYGVVKCKDTSTEREYYLFSDIALERDENNAVLHITEDPIEAIARTIRIPVPHQSLEIHDVYENIQRQGDVVMAKPKPEYIDAEMTIDKPLNREQYLTMIVAES